MDIYLDTFVEKLQVIWDGIPINNMSQMGGEKNINLRAILICIMHDFLGYGECNSLAKNGYIACPICGPTLNVDTPSHNPKWFIKVIGGSFLVIGRIFVVIGRIYHLK